MAEQAPTRTQHTVTVKTTVTGETSNQYTDSTGTEKTVANNGSFVWEAPEGLTITNVSVANGIATASISADGSKVTIANVIDDGDVTITYTAGSKNLTYDGTNSNGTVHTAFTITPKNAGGAEIQDTSAHALPVGTVVEIEAQTGYKVTAVTVKNASGDDAATASQNASTGVWTFVMPNEDCKVAVTSDTVGTTATISTVAATGGNIAVNSSDYPKADYTFNTTSDSITITASSTTAKITVYKSPKALGEQVGETQTGTWTGTLTVGASTAPAVYDVVVVSEDGSANITKTITLSAAVGEKKYDLAINDNPDGTTVIDSVTTYTANSTAPAVTIKAAVKDRITVAQLESFLEGASGSTNCTFKVVDSSKADISDKDNTKVIDTMLIAVQSQEGAVAGTDPVYYTITFA
jgi:hypothetical protein